MPENGSGAVDLADRINKLENIVWALLGVIGALDVIPRHMPGGSEG